MLWRELLLWVEFWSSCPEESGRSCEGDRRRGRAALAGERHPCFRRALLRGQPGFK